MITGGNSSLSSQLPTPITTVFLSSYYWFDLIAIITLVTLWLSFLTATYYQAKLFKLVLLIFFFAAFSITYWADSITLIFLSGEFALVFILFAVVGVNAEKIPQQKKWYKYSRAVGLVLASNILFLNTTAPNLRDEYINYTDSTCNIITSDFYLIFLFFYQSYVTLVFLVGIILGGFSIFFIIVYYCLKKYTELAKSLKIKIASVRQHQYTKLNFTRKQTFLKQANYRVSLRLWN